MKTAIITGVSRGIGREIAIKLNNNGYKVIGVYNKSEKEAKSLLPLGIEVFKCDVSNFASLEEVFNYAILKYKKIDVLINNAGICLKQKFICDVSSSEFDSVINVNLKGVFNGVKLGVKNMLFSGGKIINVSSVFAVKGGSCEAVYSASKAGVLALSRAVSEEVIGSKLEISTLLLGLIDTDMNSHLSNEEKLEFMKNCGLKKIGTSKMVASKILNILGKENTNGKVFKFLVGNS
jgi:3-oxoacyl-[acyl-carrier protein] reductase